MNLLRLLLLPFLAGATLFADDKIPSEVQGLLKETYDLQQQQRYAEAMQKLDEIEEKAPQLSDLYNMRGSLYLTPALRDFEKAEELLNKAVELTPNALAPRFNKAEFFFVKHEWATALAAFEKLIQDFPKIPQGVRHLALYKIIICQAKLEKFEDAEKTLKANFTFLDDTPAYYYGHAGIAFARKEEATAKDWLARAESIYKPEEASAYVDSLMEARWVNNISLPPVEKK